MKLWQILLIILLILMVWKRQSIKTLLAKFTVRGYDTGGTGSFGASRGKRKHEGIDILTTKGEPIYAPFNVKFIRKAFPYAKDLKYEGGLYESDTVKMKIFYMIPVEKPSFKKGDVIGYSQKISDKYSNVSDHIHLELRDRNTNELLDPAKYI